MSLYPRCYSPLASYARGSARGPRQLSCRERVGRPLGVAGQRSRLGWPGVSLCLFALEAPRTTPGPHQPRAPDDQDHRAVCLHRRGGDARGEHTGDLVGSGPQRQSVSPSVQSATRSFTRPSHHRGLRDRLRVCPDPPLSLLPRKRSCWFSTAQRIARVFRRRHPPRLKCRLCQLPRSTPG